MSAQLERFFQQLVVDGQVGRHATQTVTQKADRGKPAGLGFDPRLLQAQDGNTSVVSASIRA
jgi:hypothetical protein